MIRKRRKLSVAYEADEKEAPLLCWRHGEHSDWSILLGRQEYKVHKVILAMGERASAFMSGAFRKHLGQRADSTDLSEVVPERCWPHFEALLDFIYKGKEHITVDNWVSLIKMADVLMISSLYKKCVEVGADLITPESAPRIVADSVEFQLGGDLENQIVQIAVDNMVPQFSSYEPTDLAILPMQVFQMILQRDDLEVSSEDEVWTFLLHVTKGKSQADRVELWKCCRLNLLSRQRVLEASCVDDIPKDAILWMLSHNSPSLSLKPETPPAWIRESKWGMCAGPRGREIILKIANPTNFVKGRFVKSQKHRLNEKFQWCLSVFPQGTEQGEKSTQPKQPAAFVEIIPEVDLENQLIPQGVWWKLRSVSYKITLLNWQDESRCVTKEHTFDFNPDEVDNGYHKWLPPDQLHEGLRHGSGWLNDNGELAFKATIDIRKAFVEFMDRSGVVQNLS